MIEFNDRNHYIVRPSPSSSVWWLGHVDPQHRWWPESWQPAEWQAYNRAGHLNGHYRLFVYRAEWLPIGSSGAARLDVASYQVGLYILSDWHPLYTTSHRVDAACMVAELNNMPGTMQKKAIEAIRTAVL